MSHAKSSSPLSRRVVSLALSYTLLISLFPVFAGTAAGAAPGKPLFALPGTAVGRLARAAADRRAGELLVRFRAEVSEQERNAVAVSRGARRARLRGGSGVERFELAAGRTSSSSPRPTTATA